MGFDDNQQMEHCACVKMMVSPRWVPSFCALQYNAKSSLPSPANLDGNSEAYLVHKLDVIGHHSSCQVMTQALESFQNQINL